MARFIVLLWRNRLRVLFLCAVCPLLAFVWSVAQDRSYEAVTTVHLDKTKAGTPFLSSLNTQDTVATLDHILRSGDVLPHTLQQTGAVLDGTPPERVAALAQDMASRVQLDVVDDASLRLSYRAADATGLEKTLERLTLNFVDDLLAPERFRTDQRLTYLADQVKYYAEQEKAAHKAFTQAKEAAAEEEDTSENSRHLVALEFDYDQASTQRKLAQEEYTSVLKANKDLTAGLSAAHPEGTVWFMDPPMIVREPLGFWEHLASGLYGLLAGLLLSLATLLLQAARDRSLRSDADIREALGIRLLGRIPLLDEAIK